jgi:beta-phosphoglucomutase
MIKAVIFDFDGTLIDNMKLHFDSFIKAIDGKVKINPRDLFLKEGGNIFSIISELMAELNPDECDIKRIMEKKGQIYKEEARKLKMRPEAIELIKKLKKLNYRVGLATGSHREVLDVHISPEEYALFDHVLTTDGTKKPKPDPEPYLMCAKGLDVKPEECVAIDNAPLGVESAKSAGMICIALTSTMEKEDLKRADFVIDSLKEAEDIIKKL